MKPLVKTVIDAHARAVEQLIATVDEIKAADPALKTLSAATLPVFEGMARVEAELAAQMTAQEVAEAKAYAETKLAAMRDRAFTVLPKVGLNMFTPNEVLAVKNWVKKAPPVNALDTRYSYAGGFIICHRRCCQNDAGNGVAAGIGCWDCDDHVISESCPAV